MKYTTPCLRMLGDAVRTIRAENKQGSINDGALPMNSTYSLDPAYDLDE